MLTLFLAIAAADLPSDQPKRTAATTQATATVRIVRGAEIRFSSATRFEESVVRVSIVRERDGSARTASLVEFY